MNPLAVLLLVPLYLAGACSGADPESITTPAWLPGLFHGDPLIRTCLDGDPGSCAAAANRMSADEAFEDWELFDFVSERHELLRVRGCDAGRARDCRVLASWSDDPKLYRRAAHLYVAECMRDSSRACQSAAVLYDQKLEDSKTAMRLRRKACSLGFEGACQ